MTATMVSAAKAKIKKTEQVRRNVILRNIAWSLYQQLQAAKGDSGNPRFAYEGGTLEINLPSPEHEEANRTLARIFETLAEELDIDYTNFGSTTFDREEMQKAFEPDTCFYLAQAGRMRGKKRIDLHADPPPEVVIEIDITSSSLNKLPIYAGLGVSEIWRYRQNAVTIWQLKDGVYHQQSASQMLRGVTCEQLTQMLHASRQMKRNDWLREVRAVAQALTN